MTDAILPAWTLCRREIVRFFRQPNRIAGAVLSPFLFWFLLGSGIGRSFNAGEGSAETFLSYAFPGTLVLVLLFTAVFTTISIIEDRREGFLQSVLVSPAPRGVIVLGKVAGGAMLAMLHALVFLLIAPLAGIPIRFPEILGALGFLFVIASALTGLGFAIAWRMESIQGFHAVMNLFLLPLWVLSGAIFPASGSAAWVGWLVRANPLSYGVAGVRRLLLPDADPSGLPGLLPSALVTLAFAAATFLVAARLASGTVKGDLR